MPRTACTTPRARERLRQAAQLDAAAAGQVAASQGRARVDAHPRTRSPPARASKRGVSAASLAGATLRRMREADEVEVRVLGSLLEKQRLTPDVYPLTLNALRAACNQATSREPVVDYDDATIRAALERLAAKRFTRLASGAGSRAPKYRHLLEEHPRARRRRARPARAAPPAGPADGGRAPAPQRAAARVRDRRGRDRGPRQPRGEAPRGAARAPAGREGGALHAAPAAVPRSVPAGPPPAAPLVTAAAAPAPSAAGADGLAGARRARLEAEVAELPAPRLDELLG